MKLIVGLGNPGEKYNNSRHNVGFNVMDHLLQKTEKLKETFWEDEKKFKALIKEVIVDDEKITLMKPLTFMNLSGEAVSKYATYFKISPENICVIHDELDLPLGKIRVRFGGSGGGNNGVTSIIESLNTDKFLRIRCGIGKEARLHNPHDTSDYVLGSFEAHEHGKVKTMIKHAVKEVLLIQKHGIDLYMSKYNK